MGTPEIAATCLKKLIDDGIKVKLLVAGTGDYEDEIRAKISELGIASNVIMAGFITDVTGIMNILDLNLNASFGTEATSLSLLEGMSIGLPAVVSDFGGNPGVVQHGVNGLIFKKCDSDDMYQKLKGLLTDKAYMLDGKRYEMSMHGFARDLEWQMLDIKNDDSAEVTLLLTHSAETLKIYPFEFTFKISYRLKSGALTVTQQVTNNSDMPMPYSIGLHPYFRADKSKASIRVPSSVAYSGSERVEIKGVLKSDADIDYVCINPTGESAIFNTGLGYNVELSYQGEYNCIVVWSPTFNPNFICVEPWSATPDALNTKENLIYLKPGESQSFVMQLSVSE